MVYPTPGARSATIGVYVSGGRTVHPCGPTFFSLLLSLQRALWYAHFQFQFLLSRPSPPFRRLCCCGEPASPRCLHPHASAKIRLTPCCLHSPVQVGTSQQLARFGVGVWEEDPGADATYRSGSRGPARRSRRTHAWRRRTKLSQGPFGTDRKPQEALYLALFPQCDHVRVRTSLPASPLALFGPLRHASTAEDWPRLA